MLIRDSSYSMSYDMYEFEGCSFTNSLSPLSDDYTSIDILKAFQEHNYNYTPLLSSPSSTFPHENIYTPLDENDQIAPAPLLSSSPPSHQLESLSLHQMGNSVISQDLCPLEVKTEESHLPFFDYYFNTNYGGCDNAVRVMQRSYSSNFFDGRQNGLTFQPKFDSLIEPSNLHSLALASPDHSFSSGNMRRICSTGDLQNLKPNQRLPSSALATEGSFMEESNFKVGRYNAEERKERILRYKAKRTQRNFNKTIKYACRKTLADNRPRIRGRFARNDEPEEIPKALNFPRYEDEEHFWMDGLQEDDDERILGRGQLFNTFMPPTQFHQVSYFPK